MIELNSICKTFNVGTVNEHTIFTDFNLKIPDGEFVSVVGSNGSGKTTLLNIIGGTVKPDSGKVILDGKDITNQPEYVRSKKIGRVFQDPSKGVSPNLTVLENLALADNKGKSYGFSFAVNPSRKDFYREQLSVLGLDVENKMDTKVGVLSGGQRQAVSLIMSTLTPIDFLILDEHTAALDPRTAEIIMTLTDRIIKEKKLTAVMVTHNLRYAVDYGTRILMMDKGTAVIDKSGDQKQNLTVDDLLNTFNRISIECGN